MSVPEMAEYSKPVVYQESSVSPTVEDDDCTKKANPVKKVGNGETRDYNTLMVGRGVQYINPYETNDAGIRLSAVFKK